MVYRNMYNALGSSAIDPYMSMSLSLTGSQWTIPKIWLAQGLRGMPDLLVCRRLVILKSSVQGSGDADDVSRFWLFIIYC